MKAKKIKIFENYIIDIDETDDTYTIDLAINNLDFQMYVEETNTPGYFQIYYKKINDAEFLYNSDILGNVNKDRLIICITEVINEIINIKRQEYKLFKKMNKIPKSYDFGEVKGFIFNLNSTEQYKHQTLGLYKSLMPTNMQISFYNKDENLYIIQIIK